MSWFKGLTLLIKQVKFGLTLNGLASQPELDPSVHFASLINLRCVYEDDQMVIFIVILNTSNGPKIV